MSEYFESIKKGAEEALAWKQGKKTGARVIQTCPTCGGSVKIEGRITKYYVPISREERLIKILTNTLEEYGLPKFKDNLPVLDILQIIKDFKGE